MDIHTHILPGVDDGSPDMEETLRMLTVAVKEGITHMIATPHYKAGRHNASAETIYRLVSRVQDLADDNSLPIQIYSGNEVLFYSEVEDALAKHKICTLNETEYVLVEFSPKDSYTYIRNALDSILGMGYQPIIAHVERYECMVKHPEFAAEISQMGVKIQINASSYAGETGWRIKRFTHKLLKNRLVDYVGTDAHSSSGRSPTMQKCSKSLYKKFDEDYVNAILFQNAKQYLLGETEKVYSKERGKKK